MFLFCLSYAYSLVQKLVFLIHLLQLKLQTTLSIVHFCECIYIRIFVENEHINEIKVTII